MFDFFKKKKPAKEKAPARGGRGRREGREGRAAAQGRSRGSRDGGKRGGGGGRGAPSPKNLVVPINHNLTTAMNLGKGDERVYFGALGGMLEVGCNLYLYGHRGDWIIVDMGRGFPDEDMSGSDYTIPDISFLNAIKGRIRGLLLTHGHLDHLGAIPDLWSMVKCPVYGTPFTLGILERSLSEFGLSRQVELKKIDKEGARFKLGAFDVEYMHVTHSIPQASFLIIRTGQGAIVHTGDFKFDPTPTIDDPTDIDYIAKIGREGDIVCACDTLIEDRPTSEATTAGAIEDAIMGIKSGKIVVTCFSTNIARIGSIARAAAKKGRMVALLGRSIESNVQVAKDCDYLLGVEPVTGKDVQKFKPDQLVYVCTGNQGEPRAVLSRVADGTYEKLKLSSGDNVIFSSLVIPGNEKKISAMKNALVQQGVNIIDKRSNPDIHAHGHPVKEDLELLYKTLKPKVVMSMHGEPIMVKLAAEIARSCKVPHFLSLENGQFVAIERGKRPEIVETVPTDELYVDGSRHLTSVSEEFGARRKVNDNGALFITVAMGQKGLVGKPSVSSIGVFESDGTGAFKGALAKGVAEAVKKLGVNPSDASVKDAVSGAARKISRASIDKDPPIEVHITRV